jgi:hypothetical protein
MKRFLLLPLLASLLACPARAQAEMIGFSYSWSVDPSAVLPSGTGSVTLALSSGGSASVDAGKQTTLPGATITTTSAATAAPDIFKTDYDLKMHLKDAVSGKSADLTFAGTIAGNLTTTSSTLTSTFHDPITQDVTLGGNHYTVTIDPVLQGLPVPGSNTPAAINALCTVSPVGNVVADAPEPSSLALGAVAFVLAGAALRRRARRRVALVGA